MRYPKDHKETSHQRILEAAGRLFRTHGVAATGVDAVMSAVGLTAGGFYNHFASKNALIAEAVGTTIRANRERLTRGLDESPRSAWIEGFVRRYLSRQHRDTPEDGCPIAAMSSELAKIDEAHSALSAEVEEYVRLFETKLRSRGGATSRQRAMALFAMLVGAVSLARCLRGTAMADEMLEACRVAGAA